jgi:hypothetical protein
MNKYIILIIFSCIGVYSGVYCHRILIFRGPRGPRGPTCTRLAPDSRAGAWSARQRGGWVRCRYVWGWGGAAFSRGRLTNTNTGEVASSDQSLDTWLSRAHVLSLVSPLRLVSIRHLALLLFVPFSSCLTCRFDTCLTCLTSFFCSPRLVRKCRFDTRLTRLVCPFPRVARVEFDGSLTSERTRDPREPRHVRHEPPPRELRWARSRGSRATPCPTCHVPPVITVLVSSGGPAHVAHVRHVPLLASSGRLAHVAHVRHVPLLASSGGLAHVAHVRHFIFVF